MESSLSSTSLIDACSESGFRASVISTYSCYFPFYEEVVLRRLVAAGCTHNVIIIDAARCSEAFAAEELRPRRAGRDYTLIPVRSGGAFHPKVFLRVGKAKGALLVGSHNLTLSGFGLNDEVTNIFRAEGRSARASAAPLRAAYRFLAGFVPNLPEVVEAFAAVQEGAPWLEGSAEGKHDRRLLTSGNAEDSLWSQVLPLVPAAPTSAFIAAPFFDAQLDFVRRVLKDTGVKELTVGVDPSSVEIDPAVASTLKGVRFVNVAGAGRGLERREGAAPFLHAKIFWFKGKKSELLLTGSANPTVAAFFAPPNERNAEAIVADSRPDAQAELGLAELLNSAPPLTAADWAAVSERRTDRAEREAQDREERRRGLGTFLATSVPQGFRAEAALNPGTVLHCLDTTGALAGSASVDTADPTFIRSDSSSDDAIAYLTSTDAAESLTVIVHQTDEIAKNLGSDRRKALQQALGALDEDPSQLETLLKLAEKVIFDSETDVVAPTQALGVMRAASGGATPTADEKGSSLALEAAGRRPTSSRRRLASGDIVVLLDALIRRLGEDLPKAPAHTSGDSEEEDGESGGEDALRDSPAQVLDLEALAPICEGKVRRLTRRMRGQLELAQEPDHAKRGVVQLAAVLSVIRALRMITLRREWRMKQLELVDRQAEEDMFAEAALELAWGEHAILPRALAEAGGEAFEELSLTIGLMGWLAWDLGVDVGVSLREGGRQGVEEGTWYDAQYLALLGPWLTADERAWAILEDSVSKTPRLATNAARWLALHRSFAEVVSRAEGAPDDFGEVGRRPLPGDLVVLSDRCPPRVRVALDVVPMTRDARVLVLDPYEEEEGVRTFMAAKLASRSWRDEVR